MIHVLQVRFFFRYPSLFKPICHVIKRRYFYHSWIIHVHQYVWFVMLNKDSGSQCWHRFYHWVINGDQTDLIAVSWQLMTSEVNELCLSNCLTMYIVWLRSVKRSPHLIILTVVQPPDGTAYIDTLFIVHMWRRKRCAWAYT